jgi:hypothetical protein
MLESNRWALKGIGLTALAVALCASSAAELRAASPSLGAVRPRGVQRGAESVLTLSGGRLGDAQEILFYAPGVEVTNLEVVGDGQVKATVKVADDCRLGEHIVRVRTASGISEMRSFYVGPFPTVDEQEPNSDFAAPQKIDLNVTVAGVVQSEDVDYYVVEAKKGQRISAEIEGMRLGNTIFDPYIAIMDLKRFELSAADDSALVWQDAVASIIAPEDGNYVIQVRESAYGGNGNCMYRLHVGTFPRPTATLPAGGKYGDEVEVRFLGDVAGEWTRKIKLPEQPDPAFGLLAEDDGGVAPSLNPFRLSDLDNVIETEPNNNHDEATAAPHLPIALNGVLSEAGDRDYFRFSAKKGQTFEVHCYARRIRSPLDSVMTLSRFKGGGVASNDDSGGPDSYFRFTAPEDGEYVVDVRDHLGKGGPDYTYRIEFTPVKPLLTWGIPRVARYSQERQTIVVPRGNRFATLVSAGRANFGGDLVVQPEGLPEGVTVHADTMPANMGAWPVVFEAAPDAPVGATLVGSLGLHADANQNIPSVFSNTADMVRGAPGQSIYWRLTVDRLAVAVAEAVPFKISIVEPQVPLVQRGSMNLKVVAERQEGFNGAITIQLPFRPPGVGAASSITIPEGQNEAYYPLNANGGAAVRKWKIAVLGASNPGKGTVWVSSQLATLEITPPYVEFAMQRAAVEQGKETQIFCTVKHNTPFEGSAKVQLVGLPHNVTAPEMEISQGTQEFAFKVTTAADSPAGNHKNVFCQLVIQQNGEPIAHAVGGTELRIDKPLPPKKDAPAKPAVVAKKEPEQPKPPAAKPLTRLEKLRLEQAERAKARAGTTDQNSPTTEK